MEAEAEFWGEKGTACDAVSTTPWRRGKGWAGGGEMVGRDTCVVLVR
jgi:hypothetical protein